MTPALSYNPSLATKVSSTNNIHLRPPWSVNYAPVVFMHKNSKDNEIASLIF